MVDAVNALKERADGDENGAVRWAALKTIHALQSSQWDPLCRFLFEKAAATFRLFGYQGFYCALLIVTHILFRILLPCTLLIVTHILFQILFLCTLLIVTHVLFHILFPCTLLIVTHISFLGRLNVFEKGESIAVHDLVSLVRCSARLSLFGST